MWVLAGLKGDDVCREGRSEDNQTRMLFEEWKTGVELRESAPGAELWYGFVCSVSVPGARAPVRGRPVVGRRRVLLSNRTWMLSLVEIQMIGFGL